MSVLFESEFIHIEEYQSLLLCTFKPGIVVDRHVGAEIIRNRIKVSKGENKLVLSDASQIKYWTLSSRKHDMQEHAFHLIEKSALILKPGFGPTIWAFATKFAPPPVEIKIFTDRDKGLEWLFLQKALKEQKASGTSPNQLPNSQ